MQEEEEIIKAAKLIKECNILLFTTGAGWSADSKLPVYKDVASIEFDYTILRE